MAGRPLLTETYKRGEVDVVNYVVYASTTTPGNDEVLQHKQYGVELAHITLHGNGMIAVRETRSATALKLIVRQRLAGFSPAPSAALVSYLKRIQSHV